ncbi:hypothetical protein ARMSODRAFT_967455 [Armillaria solidipes]|uniref:Uncharacterized protein n=1 Tax=Armillaria solidipes TaxID=1076256 RepID=A0A2H3B6V9_9AGAR|nr:hypothetical protein ARMSODRAFT_967455 [Armillaria solidipes]
MHAGPCSPMYVRRAKWRSASAQAQGSKGIAWIFCLYAHLLIDDLTVSRWLVPGGCGQ